MRLRAVSFVSIALLACLLGACGRPESETDRSGQGYYEFVEPDGWWKIEAPSGWSPYRIELDGSVTPVSVRNRKVPDPAASPLRDPLASEVVYIFLPKEPDEVCEQACPSNDVYEISVVARRRRSEGIVEAAQRAIDSLAPSLPAAPADVACPDALGCSAFELSTPPSRTLLVLIDVPAQNRVYQIKFKAPYDSWPELEESFRTVLAGFRPMRS